MTELDTNEMYYNTLVFFRKNCWHDMPNDDEVWRHRYRQWLRDQGCEIVKHPHNLLQNSLGISPGYDKFVFADHKDAVMFALRWL